MTTSSLARVFGELRELVETKRRFALSGHVSIDGDSLGSMVAFYFYLLDLGREVRAFVYEPLSQRYDYLGIDSLVEVFAASRHTEFVRRSDAFIAFDLSSPSRLGDAEAALRKGNCKVVYIDHHPQHGPPPGDINVIDESACATGKIVYDYFKHCGARLTPPVARSLITAIVTDTGWFRYSNTTREAFRVMAELLDNEVDLVGLYRAIYQRNSLPLLRLTGTVTAHLKEEAGGQLLWATIPLEQSRELGLDEDYDTDVILDLLRSGDGVEVVALFREVPEGKVRVNLRSQGAVDVNRVARRFGGGGHRNAAGITYSGDLAADAERIIGALRDELDAARGAP
ncbi:MAG: bifunctional oligoribonuclease/PAP phosphatase NrnA [Planctomycetota bacterium]